MQNFVSAAVGLAVVAALIRGLARRAGGHASATSGSTSSARTLRILLPLAFVFAIVLVSQGVIQNFHGFTDGARPSRAPTQVIPGGPVASQEAIKELGTNGGGFFNANSAHPFENPNRVHQPAPDCSRSCVIPFALTYAFGRMVKDKRQGWVVFAAMVVALDRSCAGRHGASRPNGNPKLDARRRERRRSPPTKPGGNMEGKEIRFGPAACGLFAASTTGTSTGAVNSHARQLHAARRRRAARAHDARRGQPGRRRRRASTAC